MNTKVDTAVEVPLAAQQLSKGKSLQDIASMMADNTLKMRGITPNEVNDDPDPEGEIESTDVDTGDSDDLQNLPDDDVGGDEVGDDAGTGADDGESGEEEGVREGDEEDESDDPLEFEITDDDLLELDEETQVSIADLKKVYQADKTIVERVAKQEEATNEALGMRAKAEQDVLQTQGAINAMMKHVVDIVTQPLIAPPSEQLKTQNPEQYIRHLDAYTKDQERIKSSQSDLSGAVDAFAQHQVELKEARKKEEMQVLISKLPALQSESTRPQASKDILDAADHYGFAPEEVNEATDHRIYQMAYDAQQYRKMMSATGKEEVDLVEEKAKTKVRQTRSLRSRGTTAKSRLSGQAKRVKVLKTKASSTGKAKDVAAYLAAKRQNP